MADEKPETATLYRCISGRLVADRCYITTGAGGGEDGRCLCEPQEWVRVPSSSEGD